MEIMNMLKAIQDSQKKQDDRMTELENMCSYDYYEFDDSQDVSCDELGTSGTSGELDVASEKCTLNESDNRYVSVGKKLKVKETCDMPVDHELANLVTDWFRKGIEE
jgi:hypothetical protein